FVAAPCSGTVVRLLVKAPAAVVQEGEQMADVSCSEQRLEAELKLGQAAVGRVRQGQTVKLLYEAYPYQRYGVHFGRVRWVSPAGIKANEAQTFRSLAEI